MNYLLFKRSIMDLEKYILYIKNLLKHLWFRFVYNLAHDTENQKKSKENLQMRIAISWMDLTMRSSLLIGLLIRQTAPRPLRGCSLCHFKMINKLSQAFFPIRGIYQLSQKRGIYISIQMRLSITILWKDYCDSKIFYYLYIIY